MATALNTIALDLGSSTIKAAVCNNISQIQQLFSAPAPVITVDKGHCSSDALEYLLQVNLLLKQCQSHCQPHTSLGICYQRSSFVVWDSHTGNPVTPLISWQDNRGQSSCDELINHKTQIKHLSGLPLTAYYFAPKLRTLLTEQTELLIGLENKTLRVGTLDSFVIWHWTAGKQYLTDTSMAARTLLMDIHTGQWSKTLADIFTLPLSILAEIKPSTQLNLPLTNGTILQTSVADQSAAFLAHIANPSEIMVNLGTGGFVIAYKSKHVNPKTEAYLQSLIYQTPNKQSIVTVEGTLNSITAALQAYPFKACDIKDLGRRNEAFCIAEPTGLGAPFFRADLGLHFSKPMTSLSKQQIACCLLEAIIFRVALILEDFIATSEHSRIYLSGGLANLSCLQQGIAICSTATVFKCLQKEASIQGTALLVNNLAPATYRQSEAIIVVEQESLLKKYQSWKIWFNNLIH
jgi:glycerol kinase